MTEWVRIRSWHLVTPSRALGAVPTRCGLWADGEVVRDLPSNQKTCETCLKLLARDQEKAEG